MVKTTVPKSSDVLLKSSFEEFLNRSNVYKEKFLQKHFNCGFDGYSYMGQKDSSNQYDTDLLHSFVLSEFSKNERFPVEFHSFLKSEWPVLVSKIKMIELKLIEQLGIRELRGFYKHSIGHMVSCNYYPKLNTSVTKAPVRLSKHIDVSLFTVFVFGLEEGFSFQNYKNQRQALFSADNIVVFPGYLLEVLSKGKYKALQHQVDFFNVHEARFSFAFFSLPKPQKKLKFMDMEFTSEQYFQKYLSLF
ncbi:2OG-Fe(II) oxygenase family protein [Tamlana sp. 2201CG12-4]|uniref:2OG-Fe(II) oxygenase family protein n=1 Tax=Tamlana sp. 2201CG12-4 TaxID=3112582 RepID=UPI002DBB477F|nr:2OG-Fe(II) oxygenase family protein [Tamlana sp. 2201CG12-4]MEC3906578.1 2OG-Fe(II) oxygenase family protein [Tamlana sp. 2201CG12-4]